MSKVIKFFNHIVMKLLLEEMLNLMKISWPEPNSEFVPSLACESNSTFVPSSAYDPSSTFVPSSILVSSFDDDSEDENPPPRAHLPPDESFEPELAPTPTPPLPRRVVQHEKQLVIFSVILQINVIYVHSSSDPLLFWLKFQRLVI
jgi:hypothetical protein